MAATTQSAGVPEQNYVRSPTKVSVRSQSNDKWWLAAVHLRSGATIQTSD